MKIDSATRLLLFAPHPDDESLAAGGLLQKAIAAGAEVQVVFVTNGDNNPWPLRVVERQWKIRASDRLLWGMRRIEEALDALATLGVPRSAAHFLQFPDQHLTELLLREDQTVIGEIRKIVASMEPTLLIAPAPFDLHPDHSASSLLVRRALDGERFATIEQLLYAVHTRGHQSDYHRIALTMSRSENEVKRRAILCHRSQMVLSRKRFLRHVKGGEEFWRRSTPKEFDLNHPIRHARLVDGCLELQLQRRRRAGSFRHCTLYVAVESEIHGECWVVPLKSGSSSCPIYHGRTNQIVAFAIVHVTGLHAAVKLPFRILTAPETHLDKTERAYPLF